MNRKNFLFALYLFFIVFVSLEIILRIYNPFHFRLKGDKIILPVNQVEVIRNEINPRLDKIIINKRNSLGFRGPEKPREFEKALSIITVGGSTTECHFLSDEVVFCGNRRFNHASGVLSVMDYSELRLAHLCGYA